MYSVLTEYICISQFASATLLNAKHQHVVSGNHIEQCGSNIVGVVGQRGDWPFPWPLHYPHHC